MNHDSILLRTLKITSKEFDCSLLSEMKDIFIPSWNETVIFTILSALPRSFKTVYSASRFTVKISCQFDEEYTIFLIRFTKSLSHMTSGKFHVNGSMAWSKIRLLFQFKVLYIIIFIENEKERILASMKKWCCYRQRFRAYSSLWSIVELLLRTVSKCFSSMLFFISGHCLAVRRLNERCRILLYNTYCFKSFV